MELEHPITEVAGASTLISLEQEEHESLEHLETEQPRKQKEYLSRSESHKETDKMVTPAQARHVSFVVEGTCLEREYSNGDNKKKNSNNDNVSNTIKETADSIVQTGERQTIGVKKSRNSVISETDTLSDPSTSINCSETQQLSCSSFSSSLLGSYNYNNNSSVSSTGNGGWGSIRNNSSSSNNSLNVNHCYCPPNHIRAEIAALRDFAVERTIEVARVASDLGYEVVMRTPTLTAARSSMFLENNSLILSKNSISIASDDNQCSDISSRHNSINANNANSDNNNNSSNHMTVKSSKLNLWQNDNNNNALSCSETLENAINNNETKLCTDDKNDSANDVSDTMHKNYYEQSSHTLQRKVNDDNCITTYNNNKRSNIHDGNSENDVNDIDDINNNNDNSSETINDCESEKSDFDRSIDESVEVPFLVEAFHNHHLLIHQSNSTNCNNNNNYYNSNDNDTAIKCSYQEYEQEEERENAEQHKWRQIYSFSSCDSDNNTLSANAPIAFITAAECDDSSSCSNEEHDNVCHAQHVNNQRTNTDTNEPLEMEHVANNNDDGCENTEYEQPMSFDHSYNWAATSASSLWAHSLPEETSISSAEHNYHPIETHNTQEMYSSVNERGRRWSVTQENRSDNVSFDNLETHRLHEPLSSVYSASNSTDTTTQTTAPLNENRWHVSNNPESENNSYTHNYSVNSNVSSGVGVESWIAQDVSHFVNNVNEHVLNNSNNNNNNINSNNAIPVAMSITSASIVSGNSTNDNNLLHPDANVSVHIHRNSTNFLTSNNSENELNNINTQRTTTTTTTTLREPVNAAANRERVNVRNIVNVPNSTHYYEFFHS